MKRIQTSFERTTRHVNDTEAFYELKFPSKRAFVNEKDDSHIIAAGDVKYHGKIYRLSLWTDRLYISKFDSDSASHFVHRECYRCMVAPTAESDYNSNTVKVTIYSLINADNNDPKKKFSAWEPKSFEFETIS